MASYSPFSFASDRSAQALISRFKWTAPNLPEDHFRVVILEDVPTAGRNLLFDSELEAAAPASAPSSPTGTPARGRFGGRKKKKRVARENRIELDGRKAVATWRSD